MNFVDVEDLVMNWIFDTPVADITTDTRTHRVNIFLGQPPGSPTPSVVFSRVGGAPSGRSEVSQDTARISFSVWGANRPQAKAIAKALVNACEGLSETGKYESEDGFLEVGEVLSWRWFPDDKVARYIVDVAFTALGK